MKTLLVLGATGQVGGQLLRLALAHPQVGRIVAPTRRLLGAPDAFGPRLANPVVDFERLPAEVDWWRADAAICALGTTVKQAGSQAAFRRVDHDYLVASAGLARQAGTPAFALNSSLGADPDARNFYLRVKGETERDIGALGFASLTIVRPSLLDTGPRPDFRLGETVGLAAAKLLRPLIPRRYRPVPVAAVAEVMIEAALRAEPGMRVFESDALAGAG